MNWTETKCVAEQKNNGKLKCMTVGYMLIYESMRYGFELLGILCIKKRCLFYCSRDTFASLKELKWIACIVLNFSRKTCSKFFIFLLNCILSIWLNVQDLFLHQMSQDLWWSVLHGQQPLTLCSQVNGVMRAIIWPRLITRLDLAV